jgi:N-acetyl sugar amidotransferase
MKYCNVCVLPNSRPNLNFDKFGVCDGCSKIQVKTNWKLRLEEFKKLVKNIKKKQKNYDCLIPVSGGKDSTWQVLVAKKFGLKILCVTWRSPARNKLGQSNLDNLIRLGVDHIDFSIDKNIEKNFIKKTFVKFGNPLIPMHLALHAIPTRIAIEKDIPLILWGENSAYEYGGHKSFKGKSMNNKWRKVFGVNEGKPINYWLDKNLTERDLYPYKIPDTKKINEKKIKEVFLGYYFEWSPKKIFDISKKFGFKSAKKPKTGFYKFADIDDAFLITIHHLMKWYKFGFTREWDNLSIEIRNKKKTRDQALKIISEKGLTLPQKEINKFCKYIGITKKNYLQIIDKFRNKKIWYKEKNKWKIKNFLFKNWNW